jgi:N-acetylglutamate synthase
VLTGLIDGHPVSTATLVLSDAVAGVYNVATADPNRGRGYGAALTWAVVSEAARRGGQIASLQASALGGPVYESMGFRHLGDYVHLVGGA